jgi:hypothetical protein
MSSLSMAKNNLQKFLRDMEIGISNPLQMNLIFNLAIRIIDSQWYSNLTFSYHG